MQAEPVDQSHDTTVHIHIHISDRYYAVSLLSVSEHHCQRANVCEQKSLQDTLLLLKDPPLLLVESLLSGYRNPPVSYFPLESKAKQNSSAIVFSNYNPFTASEVLSFSTVDYTLQVSSSSLQDHDGVDEAIVVQFNSILVVRGPVVALLNFLYGVVPPGVARKR